MPSAIEGSRSVIAGSPSFAASAAKTKKSGGLSSNWRMRSPIPPSPGTETA